MTNAGFAQLPPDPDYIDGPPCHYCGALLLDDGDCAACEPRCLVEDSPIRFSAQIIGHGHAQRVRYEQADMFGFIGGARLALVTWEGSAHSFVERRCVGVREVA